MKPLSLIHRNWVDLPASSTDVFGFLADPERLPRWASEVFERVEIGCDGWRALTCFGEMTVELTADARSGFIYLQMGFSPSEFAVFSFWLTARTPGVTRVRLASFLSEGAPDERHEQIYRSLTAALSDPSTGHLVVAGAVPVTVGVPTST